MARMTTDLANTVVADTRHWLEQAVIGLNLCPFAKATYTKELVHYAVAGALTEDDALQAVHDELVALAERPMDERETTLLMFPAMFDDFLYFNDFAGAAEDILADLGLEGELQIASFHPRYQFLDTEPDDISNATNWAPYPTLHLLREASIDRAVESYPDVDAITEHNIERLEAMGRAGWEQLGIQTRVSGEEWVRRCPAGGRKPQPGDGGERDEAGDGDGGE